VINKKIISFRSSFSNAKFELVNLKRELYLKKKINNPKIRDFESIKKNNFFLKNIKIKNLNICSIEIKNFKDLKKKKYILIKYIDGYSGDLILQNYGLKEIKLLREFFTNYFLTLKNFTKWKKVEKNIFLKKINDIERNIKQNELQKIFKTYKKILIKKLNKIRYYPTGICHGDLTLSNIIIKDNKIYLIDFLKTYNDSVAQDLAKIYQEFILGWSSRFLNGNDIVRSKTICENIVDKKFFKSFSKEMLTVLEFEIILTLFRIFPYVKKNDIKTIKWLKESMNKIKKLNINLI
jgi:hypothetical protein